MADTSIGFTTIPNCKLLLNIPSGDSSQDALLSMLIMATTKQIESFLDRKLGNADYVEVLGVNNMQTLQLKNWPVSDVASVTESLVVLVPDVDYLLLPQYLQSGQIYRGSVWVGPSFVRGLTADPYAGELIFTVTYSAGYLLPGDVAPDPPAISPPELPQDIQLCTAMMVSKAYGLVQAGNIGENLSSIKEGGLAYSYDNPAKIPSDLFGVLAGMPVQFATFLTPYKRWSFA
jgi:hypothetical protein